MRDNIFKLTCDGTQCRHCLHPIDITFNGSDAGYDLFFFWVNEKCKKLYNNRTYYIKGNGIKYKRVCKACYLNNRVKYKDLVKFKTTGKMPHTCERSLTCEEISEMWNSFKTDVQDILWFANAFYETKYLEKSGSEWFTWFMDIYRYFYKDDKEFVYDIEDYDSYTL